MKARYGHGTRNDFFLIEALGEDEGVDLTPAQIARICNRTDGAQGGDRTGADGVIIIRKRDGKWFMDYRNSDGSLAEMCGNGIRVMARYLVQHDLQGEGIFPINTRAGMRYLAVPKEDDISVNMGKVEQFYGEIEVTVGDKKWRGYNINVGNPHAVVFVDDLADAGDLKSAPYVEPEDEYPEGVNVEFVKILENGELAMRVHERGSGETQSCGTGTCAVALAASIHARKNLPARWVINPPGGRLVVELDGHSNATLIGPALLFNEVELDTFL